MRHEERRSGQVYGTTGPRPAAPPGHQAIIDHGDAICKRTGELADSFYFQYLSYYRDLTRAPPTLPLWGGLLRRGNATTSDGPVLASFYCPSPLIR